MEGGQGRGNRANRTGGCSAAEAKERLGGGWVDGAEQWPVGSVERLVMVSGWVVSVAGRWCRVAGR